MAQSISVRRDPDFQKLWFGQTVSVFGSLISRIAIPFLAVIELDATPFDMAALGIAALLPGFVVGLLAGAWIDRRKRRPVMIGADLGRAAVLLLVPILALTDQLDIWHLLVVSGLLSILSMLFDIAYQSYLPGLVGRERLIEGNSTLTASESVAEFGSFSIGGWLVQIFTAPFALFVDAFTFLLSALAIRRIELPEELERDEAVETSLVQEAVAGFSYVRRDAVMRVLALAQALLSVSHGMTGTVFFLFVVDTLGFETGPLGMIFAVGGVASLVARSSPAVSMARAITCAAWPRSFSSWRPPTPCFPSPARRTGSPWRCSSCRSSCPIRLKRSSTFTAPPCVRCSRRTAGWDASTVRFACWKSAP